MNLIDFQHNPQAALDAPRWQWKKNKKVELEKTLPMEIINSLVELGHHITVTGSNVGYGRGQIIFRRENGLLVGGTESRIDGATVAW